MFVTFLVHSKIKIFSSKYSFRNTIRVSNSLDTDHDRHSVGPDLDPNCLQRLSADNQGSKIVHVRSYLRVEVR